MSQHVKPRLIIEWSPANVIAFDTSSRKVKEGETVAAATAGMPTGDVLVALSRRTSFIRTTRVPNASHADVGLILRNQISGLFPISGDELAYDFQLTDDVTGDGRLAMVAAIQAEYLRQLQDECKVAGLKIAATLPAALGSVELMRSKGIRDAAVVQVDESGASIDVVTQGVLRYCRWTAATRDVLGELKRTFAAAGVEQLPIMAAGGGTIPADYHASESTLVALSQVDLAKPPLNIELSEVTAAREAGILRRSFVFSGAILAAGIACTAFVAFDRVTATQRVQTAVAGETKDVATFKKRSDMAVDDNKAAVAQFQTVNRGFSPPQRFWEILSIITNQAPTGVWLTGVSIERGRPFTIRGTAMTAEQIAGYTHDLATQDRFRDVLLQFSSNTEIDNRPVVQFSITGFPIGNLPLVDTPGSGSSAPPPSTPPSSAAGGGA